MADFSYSPLDFNAGMDLGKVLFPDYADQAIKRGELAVQQGTLQRNLASDAAASADADAFNKAFTQWAQNPTEEGKAALYAGWPEHAKQVDDYYSGQQSEQRDADAQRLGMLSRALHSGNTKLALGLLGQHMSADQIAGRPVNTIDQQLYDDISSGDDGRLKNAAATADWAFGLVYPQKFAPTITAVDKATAPDTRNVGPDTSTVQIDKVTGKPTVVYTSPFHRATPGGTTIDLATPGTVPNTQGTGTQTTPGGQSGVPAVAAGKAGIPRLGQYAPADQAVGDAGFAAAFANSWNNEKGINRKDVNGYPSINGINLKWNDPKMLASKYGIQDPYSMTQDQAQAVYKGEYWDKSGAANLPANLATPYFDAYIRNPGAAAAMLARSKGDPTAFMNLADAYFRGQHQDNPAVQKAWANRDATNRQIATGQLGPAGQQPVLGGPGTDSVGATTGQTTQAGGTPSQSPPGMQLGADGKLYTVGGPGTPYPAAPPGKAWASPPEPSKTATGPLDPQVRNMMAGRIAGGEDATAVLNEYGRNSAQDRLDTLKQVAVLNQTVGLTDPTDISLQQAWHKGAVANLVQLQKNFGTVTANEDQAKRNLQVYLGTVNRLVTGNGPLRFMNAAQQALARQAGDPNIAAFDAAAKTFADEYARLTAGPLSGGGSMSDTARHEALSILYGTGSWQQKMAAANVMARDMQNRYDSYTTALTKAQRDASSLAPILRTKGLPAGATYEGTYQGKRVIRLKNGQRMVESPGQ